MKWSAAWKLIMMKKITAPYLSIRKRYFSKWSWSNIQMIPTCWLYSAQILIWKLQFDVKLLNWNCSHDTTGMLKLCYLPVFVAVYLNSEVICDRIYEQENLEINDKEIFLQGIPLTTVSFHCALQWNGYDFYHWIYTMKLLHFQWSHWFIFNSKT